MAQAIGDPEQIRNFSGALQGYLASVEDATQRLDTAFAMLGESWRDQQRASFEERYNQLKSILEAFKADAFKQIPHLNRMASDLETYLGR